MAKMILKSQNTAIVTYTCHAAEYSDSRKSVPG